LEFLFVPNKEKWDFLNVNLFQRRHGLSGGRGRGGSIANYVAVCDLIV
jgi:hypothetical protein